MAVEVGRPETIANSGNVYARSYSSYNSVDNLTVQGVDDG